jgi:hypothetical protein
MSPEDIPTEKNPIPCDVHAMALPGRSSCAAFLDILTFVLPSLQDGMAREWGTFIKNPKVEWPIRGA